MVRYLRAQVFENIWLPALAHVRKIWRRVRTFERVVVQQCFVQKVFFMQAVRDIDTALPVVATLFEQLNVEGIRYCHWKSTHGLPRALRGETDLDVLVDRGDGQRFKELLYRSDFKPFLSHPSRQFPAIEDYLGFDAQTGQLVHLHIHYRLVLGEQYAKNYYLPLEHVFLDHTRLQHGVKIPVAELELCVLVLRALLKYRDRDALHDILGRGNKSGIPPGILNECWALLAQTDTQRIARVLNQHVRLISPAVVFAFLETIQPTPRAGWKLLWLRRKVRRALAPYQRYSRLRAKGIYYRVMVTRSKLLDRLLRRFMLGQDKRKIPVSGGLTIAFVGVDGAGKSTIIKHLAKWLSWRLNVRTYYMGSAQPSLPTGVVKRVAKVARVIATGCRRVFGARSAVTQRADEVRELFEDMRFVAEGRDRYRRFRASRRKAAQGAIVIYDRYPLDALRIGNRTVDGPRIAARSNGQGTRTARLAQTEAQLYRNILPPEHVFVLHVSPDVSQQRKPEHKRELIEAKSEATTQMARDGINIIDIDAAQPLDDVLLQVKTAVWRLL